MAGVSIILGIIVIIGISISKYLQIPKIYMVVVILASVFYLRDYNNKKSIKISIEDKITKLSQFIIITGIIGIIIVKILGVFLEKFNY
jgi:hypothetical protein